MTRWFLPETPDVLGMLLAQAAVTVDAMHAFAGWASGDQTQADVVRRLEHEADDRKKEVRRALRVAFTTPVDAEDLYVLSQRLDAVVNGAKDTIRESEVTDTPPDDATAEMAKLLSDGAEHLAAGLAAVARDDVTATDAADAAIKCQRAVEKVYRNAMSALLGVDDLREVMSRRELYRRMARIADTVDEVAERIWYAVVKEG